MVDEEKNDPMWKPSTLGVGKEVIITLEGAKAVATGKSQYGTWNLWIVQVTNATVFDKNTKEKIEGYSGKAICFPPTGLHEQFLQHTNGTKENTKIAVTKQLKGSPDNKPSAFYETQLVERGQTPPSNISDNHYQFIKGFKTLVSRNIMDATFKDFSMSAKTDTWNIRDDTLIKKLWTVYQEGK